jgi:hypothetical protein
MLKYNAQYQILIEIRNYSIDVRIRFKMTSKLFSTLGLSEMKEYPVNIIQMTSNLESRLLFWLCSILFRFERKRLKGMEHNSFTSPSKFIKEATIKLHAELIISLLSSTQNRLNNFKLRLLKFAWIFVLFSFLHRRSSVFSINLIDDLVLMAVFVRK